MKLMTNLMQGKKPSLEEGQAIYTVHDEEPIVNTPERSRGCRLCMRLIKIVFYVLLLFFILLLVWIGIVLVARTLAPDETRGMCGTGLIYDYFELSDSGFNSTEVDDMTASDESDPVINIIDDSNFMELEASLNGIRKAIVKIVTYAKDQEYMNDAVERQIDEAKEYIKKAVEQQIDEANE